MLKIDLKKELKSLYNPSAKEVSVVEVPAMNFLMVDGQGDPQKSQLFQEACEALYGMAYTLKFMLKKIGKTPDYAVLPLEGLWWMDDMSKPFLEHREDWKWTVLIAQPDFITAEMVSKAAEELRKKKNPTALAKVRFERFAEGLAAQILHVGPYSAEGPNIIKIHNFIKEQEKQLFGKHHEIYLSDPRRVPEEKWRTVIRQGMR